MLEAKYTTESLHFTGKDKAMPVELFVSIMDKVQADSSKDLKMCLTKLSEEVKSSLNLAKVRTWKTVRHLLLEKYGKPNGFSILDCLHLLESLVRQPEETLENFANRVKFCISIIEVVNFQIPNAWQKILFLQGLQSPLSLVENQVEFLLKELDSYQDDLEMLTKNVDEENADIGEFNSLKLEDFEEEEMMEELPLARTHVVGQNLKRESEITNNIENHDHASEKDKKSGPDAYSSTWGFKIRHKSEWKKSIEDIDWEKPIMVQFVQDISYSNEIVAICALCVRSGKKEIHPTEDDFFKHALSCHDGNLAACDQCSYTCNTRAGIIRHRFNKHQLITEGYQRNKCPMKGCEFTAVMKKSIKIHLKKRHGVEKEKIVPTCPMKGCDFTAANKKSVNDHLNEVHFEERQAQLKWWKKQTYIYDIRTNISDIEWNKPIVYQIVEDSNYSDKRVVVCAICVRDGKKEIIPSEYEFKKHCKTQHDEHFAACDYCPYTAKITSRMVSHRFQKHDATTPNFPVKGCPKDGCKFRYCVKGDFNTHTNAVHNKDTFFKPTTCHICGKWLKHSYNLTSHVRLYHEGFRYECDQCDKKYTSSRMLTRHQDKQHRGQGYLHETVCEECGERFPKNARLEHIRRKHTKERTHHCKLCEKSFYTSCMLRNHERGVHQLGTKFQCKYCNRVMQNLSTLRVHTRLHLKKKEYHCKICDCWYTATHTLALHIAMKHIGMSREEGLKKENIAAARNHPAYEYVKDTEDPLKSTPQELE